MDRFNDHYIEFLGYIAKKFPTYKKYTTIVENPGKRYLNDFIEFNLPYMENISIRNIDIFRYKLVDVQLIKGLTFKRVLDRVYNNPRVLETVWRYLHKLYIISYNSCDLSKLVEKNYNHNEDLLKVLDNHNIYIENIMLSGHPIIERSESSFEEEDISDEEAELRVQFEKIQSGGNDDNDTNEKNNVDEEKNTDGPDMSNIFEGSVIGDLAKELSEEINPGDLGNIENMGDIVNSLLNPSAGGENKLQGIIKTVTEKMDNKMKNGEITQEQLLNDAQNMMGNVGQLFGQMGGNGASTGTDDMGNIGNMLQQMMGGEGSGDMANMMRQMGMMAGMGAGNNTGNNRSTRRRRNRQMGRKKH